MSREPVLPAREDPFVAEVSTLVGGPPGRFARTGASWWTPVRVLVALAVLAGLLGWAEKSPCRTHPYTHEYQYTRLCYTDVFVLYGTEGLAAGQVPYLDHPVEYPVLIGAAMYAVAQIDRLFPPDRRYAEFFDLTALLLAAAVVVTVVATARTSRGRPWDAALVALAPALVLNLDVNWDLIAVAFTATAMLAWSRSRPGWAGILLGLGVATKFYPLVLLVPLAALCLRAGQVRPFARLIAGAALSWVVVDLPVWLAAPSGFGYFYRFSAQRSTEFNSLWYALGYLRYGTRRLIATSTLNTGSGLLLLLGLGAVVVVVLAAPRRPRLPQVAFLALVVFVVTSKVYSPQYVLWLIPFAALARPRWRFFLWWQLAELVEFVTLYGYLIFLDTGGRKGVAYPWTFFVGIGPRDAILLALAATVAWEAWHPDRDVVRADGSDDPAGGPLDRAPDRHRLRSTTTGAWSEGADPLRASRST